MQLSAFTDYSLRVLIYVGLRPKVRASISEIAHAYGISRNHVVKVAHRLQQLGYLETFRGRSGGVELGRAADRIPVGEVVAAMENLQLVECFQADSECVLTGHCVLRRALSEAVAAFLQVLDGYTLADLLLPGSRLRTSLSLT